MPYRLAMNCPEAYHIEHLYRSGYGCTRIARVIGRSVSYVERSVRGCPTSPRLAMYVGRLSRGLRPTSELARGWHWSQSEYAST